MSRFAPRPNAVHTRRHAIATQSGASTICRLAILHMATRQPAAESMKDVVSPDAIEHEPGRRLHSRNSDRAASEMVLRGRTSQAQSSVDRDHPTMTRRNLLSWHRHSVGVDRQDDESHLPRPKRRAAARHTIDAPPLIEPPIMPKPATASVTESCSPLRGYPNTANPCRPFGCRRTRSA